MGNNKGSIFVYVIVGLAVIGVITQLFNNTAGFLTSILTMIGFGVVISVLLYFVLFRKKKPNNEAKKYKQAVKQSKAKYKQSEKTTQSPKPSQRTFFKKKAPKRKSHLRVIDGNKSKRKNRANF